MSYEPEECEYRLQSWLYLVAAGGGRESPANGEWQGPSCLLRLLAGVGAVSPGSPAVEREESGGCIRKARARKTFFNHGQNPLNRFMGRFSS